MRQSEQNFRALVEATTEFVWELDERGNLTQFPQWWVDLTGQNFSESLSYGWVEMLHPDDRERVKTAYEYALATGTPVALELQIRDREGFYRHFTARGIPIPTGSGRRPRWICALTDITRQRAAEEMLRKSEERYRLISSIATDYMFSSRVTDGRELEMEWIAGAFENITGYSPEEFIKAGGWRGIVHPDDREKDERDFALLSQNKQVDSELRIIRKNGDVIWVRVLAQPIWDEKTNSLAGICGAVQDITVRKTAEIGIRESEQRLRTIFEAVPECVKVLSEKGKLLDINPAGLAILEAAEKRQVVGRTAAGILLEEHVEPFQDAVRRAFAGENVQLIYEITGLKGTRRWLEMHAVPMRNAQGETTAVLGVSRDITEKKRLESFLITSQQQYSGLINTVEGIVWEADGSTFEFTFVSDQAQKILGYPREKWFEKGFWESHIHPEDREWAVNFCAASTSRGEPHTFEYRMIASDGRTVWLRDIVSVISQGDRKLLRGLMVDITDRRNAEAALRESEQSYRELIQNANDLIYTHDLNGNFLSLNRAGQRITGYTEEEAKQLNIADVISPEFLPTAAEMIDRKLKGSPPTIYSTEIIAKDGRRIPLEVNTRLVYRDGVPVAVQGIGRDISERLAAEEALRQSEEQLRQAQKLESIGLLAGGVAHDFNNMLTAINGYSDLLLRKLPEGDPLRIHVEEIRKAGERSAELTRQLLAFSRRQIMQPQIIDLNSTVADSARMLRRLIGEHIELLTNLRPGLPKIEIDPGQLVQVLVNLVINSRDAMPDGGTITIETRSETVDRKYAGRHVGIEAGRYVVLTVSDNGIGMDAQTRERIFEPFFTTKAVGRGTGLGLSTVYGIIKQSGGNIWVYSEPGQGTTFKIFLPEAVSESVHRSAEPHQGDLPPGSERILLVEDEDSVRMLGKEILSACGYSVIEAANGAEALNLALNSEDPIDLVITDVVMPQMGGRELVERLSAANPQIRVLFTSGYTDDAILRHGIIDKGADFLQKPFTFDALSRKVRQLLEN